MKIAKTPTTKPATALNAEIATKRRTRKAPVTDPNGLETGYVDAETGAPALPAPAADVTPAEVIAEAPVEAPSTPEAKPAKEPKAPKGPTKAVQRLLEQGYIATDEVLPTRKAATDRTTAMRAEGKRCCYQTETKVAFRIYVANPALKPDTKRSAPPLAAEPIDDTAGFRIDSDDDIKIQAISDTDPIYIVIDRETKRAIVPRIDTLTRSGLQELAASILYAADLIDAI